MSWDCVAAGAKVAKAYRNMLGTTGFPPGRTLSSRMSRDDGLTWRVLVLTDSDVRRTNTAS